MNIKIKTRFWDVNNKTMITFAPHIFINSEGIIWINKRDGFEGQDNLISTNDLIPLRFTGLKDKNGTEIYEGDIIQVCLSEVYKKHKCVVTIGWQIMDINGGEYSTNYYGSGYTPIDKNICVEEGWYEYYIVEKIGNIYENSNLLEK